MAGFAAAADLCERGVVASVRVSLGFVEAGEGHRGRGERGEVVRRLPEHLRRFKTSGICVNLRNLWMNTSARSSCCIAKGQPAPIVCTTVLSVDFAPVAKRYQVDDILLLIDVVDDPVITNPQAKISSTLQTVVRIRV
jgi:hypothetical protein